MDAKIREWLERELALEEKVIAMEQAGQDTSDFEWDNPAPEGYPDWLFSDLNVHGYQIRQWLRENPA